MDTNRTISSNYPTIRFSHAWLLATTASEVMNEKWGDGTPLQSYEFYNDVAKKYEAWWRPHNDVILQGLYEITGLEFSQNIIDVHVAPWFYAISSPMVIGVIFKTQDELINVVTHELIHRLLTDNTTVDYNFDFVSYWKQQFGEEHSHKTITHIPVHAIMQKLYTGVLKRPDLIELDKKNVANNPDYSAAWEYVEQKGSDVIIESTVPTQP